MRQCVLLLLGALPSNIAWSNTKLRSIQALRALAALGVVLFHATRSQFQLGAAGVDLFFVISGFIMALVATRTEPLPFAANRLWRIVPLYVIVALLFQFIFQGERSFCSDMASITLAPIWDCDPYLTPAWTLIIELWFYALVLFSMVTRIPLALVIVPLVIAGPYLPGELGALFLLQFLAGWMLAKLPLNRRAATWLAPVAALLLIVSPDPTARESLSRVLWWGIPAAAIVYSALSFEKSFQSKRWDGLVLAGDASYSIYLGHFLLIHINTPWLATASLMLATGLILYVTVEARIMAVRPFGQRKQVQPTRQ